MARADKMIGKGDGQHRTEIFSVSHYFYNQEGNQILSESLIEHPKKSGNKQAQWSMQNIVNYGILTHPD